MSWAFFVDFDIAFKHYGDSLSFSANLTSGETQLTISMWIRIPTALNNIALYKAGTASCDIEIVFTNMLYFIINGYLCFAFISTSALYPKYCFNFGKHKKWIKYKIIINIIFKLISKCELSSVQLLLHLMHWNWSQSDINFILKDLLILITGVFFSNEISSNITLITEKWTHVAFILDTTNQLAHIFIDGTKTFSTSIPLASGISVIDSFSSIIVQNNQENINSKFAHSFNWHNE